MTLRLALLWHMHQPPYADPATGEVLLPWVRLHATHAYLDMGRVLERHPAVKATVNFVPSLLEQLDAVASSGRDDRYLALSRTPAEALSPDESAFILRQVFMVSHERVVKAWPRYRALWERRGPDPDAIDASRFSCDDVRDLQLLFNLAWMGFSARTEEPVVARLLAQGAGFTEEDKRELLEAQHRLVAKVVPLWRSLCARGQVELSTTPYFHPILPLVFDTDSARRCLPEAALPTRFAWPDDAREQVRRALARHEATFGAKPAGMWPAEGSVSPEVLALLASEGVRWAATDEGIRHRSTPPLERHGALFRPHRVRTPSGPIHLFFRDRTLSDRVGFSYTSMSAKDAVADFIAHARSVEAEAREAGVEKPLLPVVLDGENAWEHYEDHGGPFLEALHEALSHDARLRTVTLSEALDEDAAMVEEVHTGSWIDANFRIWIGHPEDNLAWSLLGAVRTAVDERVRRGDVSAESAAETRTHLLAAEASDWFWWYGDDFTTDNAVEFDRLFRDRLLRACALVGVAAPSRLLHPLSRQALGRRGEGAAVMPPTARLNPPLDGRPASFFDWLGAGRIAATGDRGSMHRSSGGVRRLDFGFGDETLFLRMLCDESLLGAELEMQLGERTVSLPLVAPGPVEGPVGIRGHLSDHRLVLAVPQRACPGESPIAASWTLRRRGGEQVRVPASGAVFLTWPSESELRWRP